MWAIFILLASGHPIFTVSAGDNLQDPCADVCICEGYTPEMLYQENVNYLENRQAYGDSYPSDCLADSYWAGGQSGTDAEILTQFENVIWRNNQRCTYCRNQNAPPSQEYDDPPAEDEGGFSSDDFSIPSIFDIPVEWALLALLAGGGGLAFLGALGAVLWRMAKSGASAAIPPATRLTKSPQEAGFKVNAKGEVLYKPPWDTGDRPYWISRAEFDSIQRHLANGEVWSNRYGWKHPNEQAALQTGLNRQRNYVQSGQAGRDLQRAAQEAYRQSAQYQALQQQIQQDALRRAANRQAMIDELNAQQQFWDEYWQGRIEYNDSWASRCSWVGIAAGAAVTGLGAALPGLAALGSTTPAAINALGYVWTAEKIATVAPFVTATTSGITQGVVNDLGLLDTLKLITTENRKAAFDYLTGKLTEYGSGLLTRGIPDAWTQTVANGLANGSGEFIVNGLQEVTGLGEGMKDFFHNYLPQINMEIHALGNGPVTMPNVIPNAWFIR